MIPVPLDRVGQLDALLERVWCSPARRWVQRRDACAIGLGLCGLRFEEVRKIRVGDWDCCDGRLRVRSAKGGHIRTVVAGCSLLVGLEACLRDVPPRSSVRGFAFYTRTGHRLSHECVRRRLARVTVKLFGRAYSFHCLRHTAALRVYEATRDVLVVQQFLGHRSLMWTEAYLRSLRVAVDRGMPTFVDGASCRLRVFYGDESEVPVPVQCVAPVPAVGVHDCISSQHVVVDQRGDQVIECSVCGRFLAHSLAVKQPGRASAAVDRQTRLQSAALQGFLFPDVG